MGFPYGEESYYDDKDEDLYDITDEKNKLKVGVKPAPKKSEPVAQPKGGDV